MSLDDLSSPEVVAKPQRRQPPYHSYICLVPVNYVSELSVDDFPVMYNPSTNKVLGEQRHSRKGRKRRRKRRGPTIFRSQDIQQAVQYARTYKFKSVSKKHTMYPHYFGNQENIDFPEDNCYDDGETVDLDSSLDFQDPENELSNGVEVIEADNGEKTTKRNVLFEYPLLKNYKIIREQTGPAYATGHAGMYRIILNHKRQLCGVILHSRGGKFFKNACKCVGC
ncbi:hypothetical protein BKA69DRAFT_1124789 [Paraphysoderma sedebokerense]|nr:hypothetical protein BKA69DRAFT_1124789 [Paraphysoderma sedebokerense]